jgi:hypothetical protein
MEEAATRDGNGGFSKRNLTLSVEKLTHWLRLFIVDGIISLPVALAGYFVLPDLPEIAKPFYLTKKVYYNYN